MEAWVEKGKREGVRLQFDSPGQRTRFSRATKKVLACSHSRSLQLLCTVGGSQARLDARTEFEILERSPKGGVEAGRAHHCKTWATAHLEVGVLSLILKLF